jgi:hypothetical protein
MKLEALSQITSIVVHGDDVAQLNEAIRKVNLQVRASVSSIVLGTEQPIFRPLQINDHKEKRATIMSEMHLTVAVCPSYNTSVLPLMCCLRSRGQQTCPHTCDRLIGRCIVVWLMCV